MQRTPCIIVTRPVGSNARMLRAARMRGAQALALPGLSLRPTLDGAAASSALRHGLSADKVLFTSPAAVRFAARLQALPVDCPAMALGGGTAAALRRAGIREVAMPDRADSEGVLALPSLQAVHNQRIALVGAPGGRGLLEATLAERGARVERVHVYRRTAARLDRRHWQRLRELAAPPAILLSSRATLAALQAGLPAWAWAILCSGVAVVSSERLDVAAATAGFEDRVRARSALGRDLLDAVPGLAVTDSGDT